MRRIGVKESVWAVTLLVATSGCDVGLCDTWHPQNCHGDPPASFGCAVPGTSLWECNVVGGPHTVPGLGAVHEHFVGASCGSYYCATSEADARAQSGFAGDPSLSCATTLPTWTSCLAACDPCDDGAGGTLQSVGEHCGYDYLPYAAHCCHGLTCVGASATAMGTCGGTLAVCETPDAGITAPCRNLGESCAKPFGGPTDCCASQQIASGRGASALECEATDVEASDGAGFCRVKTWQPCTSAAQCFQQNTADGMPEDCQGGSGAICCYGLGRQCWAADIGGPDPAYQGCCSGLARRYLPQEHQAAATRRQI